MQIDCDAYLWQHCPKTVHRFNAFAQRLDGQKGTNPALKWQNILVSTASRAHTLLAPHADRKLKDSWCFGSVCRGQMLGAEVLLRDIVSQFSGVVCHVALSGVLPLHFMGDEVCSWE